MMDSASITTLSIPSQLTLYTAIALTFCITWKLVKHLRQRTMMIPVWSANGEHHWQPIGIMTHTAYCLVCHSLIVDGMFCDSCGICTDYSCHKKANAIFHCKQVSLPMSEYKGDQEGQEGEEETKASMKHHWVHGNLPVHSICDICKEECGDESALVDYRCCWCQRCAHESDCFQECSQEECDFGEYRRCIVPPFTIFHKKLWVKGRRKLVVSRVEDFKEEPNWKPLLVIANKKSGNNDGDKILKSFRAILNPIQVIDLNETSMEDGLEWCALFANTHKNINVRILVAGGDGTVGWTLNTIEKLKLDPLPWVGVLPLGTGNDLSRILGWGDSFSCESSMDHVMNKVLRAGVTDLDRWKVKFSPGRSSFGIPVSPPRTLFMNNYFSIGVDALVVYNFHKTRESKIYNYFFNNRFFNKCLYLIYGTKDGWERRCKKLNEKIKLEMDGKEIELPELESIVVLNINSWSGGCDLYNLGSSKDVPKQRINDKQVEVLGMFSTFHIGQLLIGLNEPLRFGQAKVVKIKLMDRLPMQVDGEPCLQLPTTITISWNSQAKMLTTRSERRKSRL